MGVQFGFDLDKLIVLGMVGGVFMGRKFVGLLGGQKLVRFHAIVSL